MKGKKKHNQYYKDGSAKLSNSQRRNAVIVAGLIVAGIAFLMWGLTAVFPGALTAHGTVVAFHHHATLTIIDDTTGQRVYIPPDVGNEMVIKPSGTSSPGEHYVDKSLAQFGIPGYAPLHTHGGDTLIHMESVQDRTFTLGDFLNIWGDTLFDGRAGVLEVSYQGEVTTETDYRNHIMRDGESLTLTLNKLQVILPAQ